MKKFILNALKDPHLRTRKGDHNVDMNKLIFNIIMNNNGMMEKRRKSLEISKCNLRDIFVRNMTFVLKFILEVLTPIYKSEDRTVLSEGMV